MSIRVRGKSKIKLQRLPPKSSEVALIGWHRHREGGADCTKKVAEVVLKVAKVRLAKVMSGYVRVRLG